MELLLDELRVRYDEEESRREGVDTKASILLSALGIVLGLLLVFPTNSALYPFVVGLALGSAFAAVVSTRLAKYKRPGGDYADFYRYARLSRNEFADRFILSYIDTLKGNSSQISRKQKWLWASYGLFVATLLGLALMSLLR